MSVFRSGLLAITVVFGGVALSASPLWAQSTASPVSVGVEYDYFSIEVTDLIASFDKSQIVSDPPVLRANFYQMKTDPQVSVPSGCEGFLLHPETKLGDYRGYRILGRKPKGTAITGKLFILRSDPDPPSGKPGRVLGKFEFKVAADQSNGSETDYHKAKGEHFQRLWSPDYAGAAMFRHLALASMARVGKKAVAVGPGWPMRRRSQGADATIALMAGGRAVSENLSLDSTLDDPKNYLGELQDLTQVRGITLNEIDWKRRLSKVKTELDPLAKLVPHDQYAVFVPSFEMLTKMVDQGGELARPLVHWFEPQSRKTDVLAFYQGQLGIPMNALTREVGDKLIGEIAITGSDSYFRTGTDIAVLMRSDRPKLLYQAIAAQVATQAIRHKNSKHVNHQVDNHSIAEWSNPTRHLSSYVAVRENAVVVSNSIQQMIQVLRCADGNVQSMHKLNEYKFFRQRYPRRSANSALIVVTDAAIRRWCGPQWRISASRRTRARATIADATMQHADALLSGGIETDRVFHADSKMPNAGTMTLTSSGILSSKYGTLDFQTPIAEMNLWQATTQEVALYTRWRTNYERRWRRVFDPIALEMKLEDGKLTADLSVIPLIMRSDYQQYRQLVGKVRLKPNAGDHHVGSLGSIDIALDTNAPMFAFARMFLQSQMNGVTVDPLAWVDGSASVYFDYDKDWLEKFEARDPWDFNVFQSSIEGLPVGIHVPSKDTLRLTAFVVAIRSLLNQYAPNTIQWGTQKYKDYSYVTMRPVERPRELDDQDVELLYVTLPDGITLSGNRGVIERAIDRYIQRKKLAAKEPRNEANPRGETEEKEGTDESDRAPDPSKVLAPQIAMQVTGKGISAMTQSNYDSGLRRMHQLSWGNIPILNYFRHRYPKRDPFTVYKTLFGETLVEPSGGKYEWNETVQSYVSSQHGYHLEPKAGLAIGTALRPTDRVRTTMSFQDGGIRATLSVTKNAEVASEK